MTKRLRNIHPGEVLLEEFLRPMGLSQNLLAREIGVPPRRVNEIVLGKRGITADTAIRRAHPIGASQARRSLGALLHKVERGFRYTIMRQGRPVALLERSRDPAGNGQPTRFSL